MWCTSKPIGAQELWIFRRLHLGVFPSQIATYAGRCDVLCVASGMAVLSAALRLLEAGQHVVGGMLFMDGLRACWLRLPSM